MNKIQRATWRTDGDWGPECSSQIKWKTGRLFKDLGGEGVTERVSNAEGIVTNELTQVQALWGFPLNAYHMPNRF